MGVRRAMAVRLSLRALFCLRVMGGGYSLQGGAI